MRSIDSPACSHGHALFDPTPCAECECECEPPSLNEVLTAIAEEVQRAEASWPPMNSAHEAYAVLLEEVDELKAHVWMNQKRRDPAAMRKEAVQVAAMAVRFIRDICDGNRSRK